MCDPNVGGPIEHESYHYISGEVLLLYIRLVLRLYYQVKRIRSCRTYYTKINRGKMLVRARHLWIITRTGIYSKVQVHAIAFWFFFRRSILLNLTDHDWNWSNYILAFVVFWFVFQWLNLNQIQQITDFIGNDSIAITYPKQQNVWIMFREIIYWMISNSNPSSAAAD